MGDLVERKCVLVERKCVRRQENGYLAVERICVPAAPRRPLSTGRRRQSNEYAWTTLASIAAVGLGRTLMRGSLGAPSVGVERICVDNSAPQPPEEDEGGKSGVRLSNEYAYAALRLARGDARARSVERKCVHNPVDAAIRPRSRDDRSVTPYVPRPRPMRPSVPESNEYAYTTPDTPTRRDARYSTFLLVAALSCARASTTTLRARPRPRVR